MLKTAKVRISNKFKIYTNAEKRGPKWQKNCWMTLPKTKQRTENRENMW